MTKNNKPILSILIDEDKRVRFAALAKRNSLSMSYLVNQAIDRMLEADSVVTSANGTIQTINELVKVNIEPRADRLAKLEADTRLQFAAVWNELKKPLTISR